MINVCLKLKRLRGTICEWNWSAFGDVNRRVVDLTNTVEDLEHRLQATWTASDESYLCDIKARLNNSLEDQQSILADKCHLDWISDGDRISKLFHMQL